MATLPTVSGVVAIVHKWQVGEDVLSTTKVYASTSSTGMSQTALAALANSIGSSFSSVVPSCCSPQVTHKEVDVIDLSSSAQTTGTFQTGYVGTRTGGMLPAMAAFLVNYKIARRYRGGKPRSYLPLGTVTDLADAQTWSTSALGAGLWTPFNTKWNGQFTLTATGAVLTGQVNVSYHSGSTYVAVGTSGRTRRVATLRATPVVDTILSTAPATKLGSQRKRMVR